MTDQDEDDSDFSSLIEEFNQRTGKTHKKMAEYLKSGHLTPGRVSSHDAIRVAFLSGGSSSWLREVGGIPTRRELEVYATEIQADVVDYVPLPPMTTGTGPRNSLTELQNLIHIGIFIGEFTASATGAWAIGKALDRVQHMASSAWSRNVTYWKGYAPHGFWFVVSIWNSADRYWAVVAIETSSSLPDQAPSLTSAYNSIVRSMSRKSKSKHANLADESRESPEAALITVQGGQISRLRVFNNIEDAIERLGNVPLITTQGLLEALWVAKHPNSSLARRVCQVLQENPNQRFTVSTLALMSGCSSATVRTTLHELALMRAPICRLSDFKWAFEPGN